MMSSYDNPVCSFFVIPCLVQHVSEHVIKPSDERTSYSLDYLRVQSLLVVLPGAITGNYGTVSVFFSAEIFVFSHFSIRESFCFLSFFF